MAERDRRRLAAVLAADPELQVFLRASPPLHGDPHQVAHSALVEDLERVALEHAVLEVVGEELPFRVVAREPERRLRQVVRAEREEVGVLGDLVCADARTRELDHRAAQILDVVLLGGHGDGQRAQPAQLFGEGDERVHDLDERRLSRLVLDGFRRADDRAHLHLVDLRELQPEPAAARAEHRVRLLELLDPFPHLLRSFFRRGQELVQRRVEQPDRDRESRHRLEDPLEVGLLHRQQPVERAAAALLVARHDHLLHDGQPLVAEEHVLGAAEADPLRAELARADRVLRCVGVRAHLQLTNVVGPPEHRLEVLVDLRRNEAHGTDDHAPGATVDRQLVAFAELVLPDARDSRLQVERQRVAARNARLPHAARDDGRVRGHAAVDGEDPLRRDHPVDVVGRRLPAHEDHVLALAPLDRGVCVEDDLAARRARACVETRRGDVVLVVGVEHRVEQLVELRGVDPRDRVIARDQPFVDHVDGRFQRRGSRALRGARLQQVEPPRLDGELDVLHVAVVLLEPAHRLEQLLVRLRQPRLHRLERLRRADPRDDVLALRVGEKLAVQPLLARRRVAREAHAGPQSSPRLPKTIWTTLTAVPRSSGIPCARRYTCARGFSQEAKTAPTARRS